MNTGRFISNGNISFNGSSVDVGDVSNLKIQGGFPGQILTTDGVGNLSFTDAGEGGNGTPSGSNTTVQYNNSGAFGGSQYFTFNNITNTLSINGNFIANSIQMGAGAYTWSTSYVFFAATASATPQQILYSVPVANISGVEFALIATQPSGPSRQSCKINALYYNGTVDYNEYASLFVNGGVGNFEVEYNGGNIVLSPSLELKVTPNSANPITYKMLITIFAA
jgi:hypothetical protein